MLEQAVRPSQRGVDDNGDDSNGKAHHPRHGTGQGVGDGSGARGRLGESRI